ncbi:hypothetical protein GCM10023231_34780 [Olivibacter ginsenosidimutans]|uniref:HAD family hydrolase n=1 Tax=Olivibacter ginsenosidimutans TaxID=1176537 RepID=A0ABP9BZQ4_9SPHI
MNLIKHYSFDLWLTLIKSNPLFKKERAQYFYEKFNWSSFSLEAVEAIFRQVDVMCNLINEKTGKNIDADEMYLMVISMMNPGSFDWESIAIDELYREMEALVFKHLPQLFCEDTPKVLDHLKSKGYSLNILSNTGFIKGITLREVLKKLQVDTYFDFQLYSDETGYSKPNHAFFELMFKNASAIYPQKGLHMREIMHIGDNPRADIQGAGLFGIKSMLINSNQLSITQLMQLCP